MEGESPIIYITPSQLEEHLRSSDSGERPAHPHLHAHPPERGRSTEEGPASPVEIPIEALLGGQFEDAPHLLRRGYSPHEHAHPARAPSEETVYIPVQGPGGSRQMMEVPIQALLGAGAQQPPREREERGRQVELPLEDFLRALPQLQSQLQGERPATHGERPTLVERPMATEHAQPTAAPQIRRFERPTTAEKVAPAKGTIADTLVTAITDCFDTLNSTLQSILEEKLSKMNIALLSGIEQKQQLIENELARMGEFLKERVKSSAEQEKELLTKLDNLNLIMKDLNRSIAEEREKIPSAGTSDV
jgi:hypothetical protein